MKTSELKRILREDCAEVFSESEHSIYGVFWTVWKKEQRLVVRGFVPLGIITTLGKYHNTPISEREDEKKYYIHQPINNQYLNYDIKNKFYFMFEPTNTHDFKTIFTQQEIDNFPAEIKGAIECGFLRKAEVNDA